MSSIVVMHRRMYDVLHTNQIIVCIIISSSNIRACTNAELLQYGLIRIKCVSEEEIKLPYSKEKSCFMLKVRGVCMWQTLFCIENCVQ